MFLTSFMVITIPCCAQNTELNTQHMLADTTIINSIDAQYKDPYSLEIKDLIIPSVCITYGIMALTVNGVKNINYSTREEIKEHQLNKIKLDNYTQYFPGLAVYGLNTIGIPGKHNLRDRTIILATSQLIAAAIVTPLKHTVGELRPDGSNHQSFPSGHTTTAFSTAHFMFREYKDDHLWLGLAGYPFAIFTGVYRTLNNKHWVGDVAAGAGIGILSTELAYWAFPTINKLISGKHHPNSQSMIYPYYEDHTFGIGLIKNF